MPVVHAPQNEMPRIDFLWAFLSVDETGEGILAAPLMGPGSLMPLVAGDQKRLDLITPIAKEIARDSGRNVRLVKFSQREVIEQFGGH